ncbi:coiled-coil domain-containing protein 136 [Protopterus annectens]|uniref:coiled-coil domain-containing protein 136 n=1 Tax=Protopterus annectens TaxID=7888 RepID=UPI001CF9A45F|nr:coiled-coil domain-containing protein 136 [Protopterus annectens]
MELQQENKSDTDGKIPTTPERKGNISDTINHGLGDSVPQDLDIKELTTDIEVNVLDYVGQDFQNQIPADQLTSDVHSDLTEGVSSLQETKHELSSQHSEFQELISSKQDTRGEDLDEEMFQDWRSDDQKIKDLELNTKDETDYGLDKKEAQNLSSDEDSDLDQFSPQFQYENVNIGTPKIMNQLSVLQGTASQESEPQDIGELRMANQGSGNQRSDDQELEDMEMSEYETGDMKSARQEIEDLRIQVQQLMAELEEAREVSQRHQESFCELQGLLEDERLASAQQAETFTKEILKLQAQLRSVQEELDSLEEEKESELMEAQEELRCAREEIIVLRQSAEDAAAERENDIATLQEELCRVRAELEQLQRTTEEYELEITTLRAEIQMKGLGGQDKTQQELVLLEGKKRSLQDECRLLVAECQALRDNNTLLKEQLQQSEEPFSGIEDVSLQPEEILSSEAPEEDKKQVFIEAKEEPMIRHTADVVVSGDSRSSLLWSDVSEDLADMSQRSYIDTDDVTQEGDNDILILPSRANSCSNRADLIYGSKGNDIINRTHLEVIGEEEEASLVELAILQGQLHCAEIKVLQVQKECEDLHNEVRELEERYKISQQQTAEIEAELKKCREEIQKLKGSRAQNSSTPDPPVFSIPIIGLVITLAMLWCWWAETSS